jgi:hypothetical protein
MNTIDNNKHSNIKQHSEYIFNLFITAYGIAIKKWYDKNSNILELETLILIIYRQDQVDNLAYTKNFLDMSDYEVNMLLNDV